MRMISDKEDYRAQSAVSWTGGCVSHSTAAEMKVGEQAGFASLSWPLNSIRIISDAISLRRKTVPRETVPLDRVSCYLLDSLRRTAGDNIQCPNAGI